MEKNKIHILVVDDDNRIRELIKEYLNEYHFIVSTAIDAHSAKIKMEQLKFDLIILDVMMPGQSGFDLTKEIKKNNNIPIILLTAKGEVENRIKGLELGADDYLAKPFEPKELLARIQSVLRRVKFSNSLVDVIEFDGLVVDKVKEEVVLNGEVVHLSTSEFEALSLFVDNNNEVLDREFLVENLRGIRWQTFDRSVDVLVSRLRNKLGETPNRTRYLKTIHGVGYKFVAKPKN